MPAASAASKKPVKKADKGTNGKNPGFTSEEKAAMKARAKELKAAATREAGEKAVLEALAKMPASDRTIGERLHKLISKTAPDLAPKTWYGMPAYAKDDRVLCFLQSADKFGSRYATLGFSDIAALDKGDMWPTYFALSKWTPTVEKDVTNLLKKAIG